MVKFDVTVFDRRKIMEFLQISGQYIQIVSFLIKLNQTFNYFEKLSYTKSEPYKLP